MTIIVDAQLSPHLAFFIEKEFGIKSFSVSRLGLRDADDRVIFNETKKIGGAIILTKDDDFLKLINQYGSPPKVILLSCGNTSNSRMKEILIKNLHNALELLLSNNIVEIID